MDLESQKLLKKNRKKEEREKKRKSKKNNLNLYILILNNLKKNCIIIIIISILILIIFVSSKIKNNNIALISEKEQLIKKTINRRNMRNENITFINKSAIDNNSSFINKKNKTINNHNFLQKEIKAKIPIQNKSREKVEVDKNNKTLLDEEEITFEEEEEIDNKKEEKNINMTNILEKINKYIYFCKNDILINGIRKSSFNPKITAVIASYNSEKTIKASIRSIQNQKLADLEIIIVDDASTDKSLQLIEKMQKEDSRIKIIKNKENMGPLYSKSIGALEASGKYIMPLDSDDLFINENIFNICYEQAEENNIDILEFSGFRNRNQYFNISKTPKVPLYLRYKKNNLVVNQPELSTFIYRKYFNKIVRLIDGYLWGKCIRTDIYRKALDTIGKDIYEQKVYYGDDRIVNFILFRIASSFKYINEYGIVYYNTPYSIINSRKRIRNCHDELINIMNIFHFTKNSKDSEIAVFELKIRWKRLIKPGLNEENIKYARNLIKQMLQCKFISRKYRKAIYDLWINRQK